MKSLTISLSSHICVFFNGAHSKGTFSDRTRPWSIMNRIPLKSHLDYIPQNNGFDFGKSKFY